MASYCQNMNCMVYRYLVTLVLSLLLASSTFAQSTLPAPVRDSIGVVLQRLTLKEVAGGYVKLDRVRVRNSSRTIEVYASVELAYYPMRRESVDMFYDEVRDRLPAKYKSYNILIYAGGTLLDRLIPQYYHKRDGERSFTNPSSKALITRLSNLSQPTKGLLNRHIALWQSHGRYYDQRRGDWRWQRSLLWETVEDLYTQSYVLPYLVPMLERAGATVLLPRERSLRCEELIIDNDGSLDGHSYTEYSTGKAVWHNGGVGFAHLYESYPSGHNPFADGTLRRVATTSELSDRAVAQWGGVIPVSGIYTVYVSYATLNNSVEDAHYTVHATGGDREFLVNQRMGGAMWVPLGEFYFSEGEYDALVSLDNISSQRGVVVADAVKIGGGMGNIRREVCEELRTDAEQEYSSTVSGYPRFTEGARYWLQWSGFDEEVYAAKEGKDDYKEDYMSRAHWVNALMGGSARLEKERGKSIPVDLALAFHSDAGVRLNDDIIGTLGIYSTREARGRFSNGISRQRSRDLTDVVMTQIVDDIRHLYEPRWTRRGMWDRAYYEARMPSCPTMLLELLSHQNFADMRYGLDPSFRFDVSRAIYKGILRYLSSQYGVEYVVQPLPVQGFSCELRDDGVHLGWRPTTDSLESTATPDYYILYTRRGDAGFDCGVRVDGLSTVVDIDEDKIYSFCVTAVNEGGESFSSEILAACRVSDERGHMLVVNGFDRVAAPMSVQGDSIAGFFNRYDSGVAYIKDISFVGEQVNFDRRLSRSENDANALGQSYNDYETEIIAGNTFDYPSLHGRSIQAAGYSFSSASRNSVECGAVDLGSYDVVDIIMGKQRTTTIGRGAMGCRHEVFGDAMQDALRGYMSAGGRLFISGSYIFTDLWESPQSDDSDKEFARDVLHAEFGGGMASRRGEVRYMRSRFANGGHRFRFNTELNDEIYCVESPEVILPSGGSYTILRYGASGGSAAVAYDGECRSVVAGFPFETITSSEERDKLMQNVINFLTKE